MRKLTEEPSYYRHLEQMNTYELLSNINREDRTVPLAVEQAIPQIERLVDAALERMREGGRLFYIGAGTSGRLGILDASECPPTYGVPEEWVIGLIAGGDQAIRRAVEAAEDSETQAWIDLRQHRVDAQDFVVGIAASGTTPYVIGGLRECRSRGIRTGCITCNPDTPLAAAAEFPIEVLTGPEFVTGSTRMKAGTAQKLVLNMISTSIMVQLGRVVDNRMVDMQLTNEKLIDRGARMIAESLQIDYATARARLLRYGSVRRAIDSPTA